MAKRHVVSAQTRVKLSRAAKQRRRGPKGSEYAGKFMDALNKSGAGRLAGDGRGSGQFGTSGSHDREVHAINRSEATRRVKNNPARAADEIAYRRTLAQTGKEPGDITRESLGMSSPRVSSAAQREVLQQEREQHWDKPGMYTSSQRKPPARFIKEEMSSSHRAEHEKRLKDPNSVFNRGLDTSGTGKAGSRRRQDQYFTFLQQGLSDKEALQRVAAAHQGPQGPRKSTRPTGLDSKKKNPTRKRKYEATTSRKDELSFGVSSSGFEKASKLADRYDLPEANLIQMQESQKMVLSDQLFDKNAKWAHETRRSNILGDQAGQKTPSDRVVLFTTNLGSPNPSVPADSLIGQYVIRKRGNMLKAGGWRASELRGAFPEAVRDKHVVELATGIHWGVEGASGAYRRVGWRRGQKTSKNFMRPVPLGAQVLYDSGGRPLYDTEGNIRYSEGGTRKFRYETPDVGLRVFIG